MKNNGNILLVANWESNVGYAWWLMENFWVEIAQSLKKKNIESLLIYPKITTLPQIIASSEIQVVEHDLRIKSINNLLLLQSLIKTHKIRHIYLSDYPAYHWLYLWFRFSGIKNIIIHDHTPGERAKPAGLKRLVKSIIQRLPLITATHFIAVTGYVYSRFIEIACIPAKKCSCAPNGIVPLNLSNTDKRYAHKQFNIPENKIIVVTTGRATYYKGIDFFVECANRIVNELSYDNFHFLYCGDGPDIDEFKALATKYELKKNFTFAGKRTDIREILPSCNIGFHTSSGEVGYSLSILEYMSAELLTIVPNNPSTALATTEYETGLTYKPNNLSSAAASILKYIDKTDKRVDSIGERAADYVKKEKNLLNTNRTLADIIGKIVT